MDSLKSEKISQSDIPRGCTHVEFSNPLNFDQRPTFMRCGFAFTGPESGNKYYCWFIWHHFKHRSGCWVKDLGYYPPDDKSLFQTVAEYSKQCENSLQLAEA